MGARIDEQINDGRGPYVFRVSGQVCHMMGSILPPEGCAPAFEQLYMHDTENEIENRMSSFRGDGSGDPPGQEIIQQLSLMLDEYNAIVRGYRSVNERLAGLNLPEYRLCIRNNPLSNSSQYSMPQASEVVGLVVGDLSAEQRERDLIVEHRSNGLQRVSSTHPLYMPMQYPLLFPYGEPGYTTVIRYRRDRPGGVSLDRPAVTMLEYYLFHLHERAGETSLLFYVGRLFQQYLVDAYACVEQARLHKGKK